MATLRVPPAIAALASPPNDFIPCRLHQAFAVNFKNHAEFSSNGKKTYWVIFAWPYEAVYTLKTDCLAAKGPEVDERDVIASFAEWAEVLRVWAAFCYRHHGKCEHHPHACVRTCPAHPPPEDPPEETVKRDPRVRVEVKVESRPGASVKRERGTPQLQTKAPTRRATTNTSTSTRRAATDTSTRRRRVSLTPVPRSPSDDSDVVEPGGMPLFAPDTPPPTSRKLGSAGGADVEGDEDAARSRSRRGETAAPARAVSAAATSPPTSTTLSSASSLSNSTVDAPAKGKGRAVEPRGAESSVSRARSHTRATSSTAAAPPYARAARPRGGTQSTVGASTSGASASRAIGRNDPFFVSAAGRIHDNAAAAFQDIAEGPVQAVVGWDAATMYAVRLAEKASRAGEGDGVDVDM